MAPLHARRPAACGGRRTGRPHSLGPVPPSTPPILRTDAPVRPTCLAPCTRSAGVGPLDTLLPFLPKPTTGLSRTNNSTRPSSSRPKGPPSREASEQLLPSFASSVLRSTRPPSFLYPRKPVLRNKSWKNFRRAEGETAKEVHEGAREAEMAESEETGQDVIVPIFVWSV